MGGSEATNKFVYRKVASNFRPFRFSLEENSIAFGKSTSQRIYPEQHTPKIG